MYTAVVAPQVVMAEQVGPAAYVPHLFANAEQMKAWITLSKRQANPVTLRDRKQARGRALAAVDHREFDYYL